MLESAQWTIVSASQADATMFSARSLTILTVLDFDISVLLLEDKNVSPQSFTTSAHRHHYTSSLMVRQVTTKIVVPTPDQLL